MFLVIGDSFFKVDQMTLAITLQSDLAKKADLNQPPQPNNRQINGGFNFAKAQQNDAPVAKIKDNVMVILKQDEILLVDTFTGKVSMRNALSKEFAPAPAAAGGFGQGGPPVGGANAGGGAAAGGAAPAGPAVQN